MALAVDEPAVACPQLPWDVDRPVNGCSRDQDSLFNCANLLLDMKQVTYVAQTPASQGVKRRSEPDLCSVLCAQARTAQAGGRRGFRGYKVLTGV